MKLFLLFKFIIVLKILKRIKYYWLYYIKNTFKFFSLFDFILTIETLEKWSHLQPIQITVTLISRLQYKLSYTMFRHLKLG
jgi:hypothetical protein